MGTIEPKMGSQSTTTVSLADALFPKVRQRVLALLFGQPDRSFFGKEVMALAQSGTGAVQRELQDLTDAGLLTVQKIGNQKHYRANRESPVFEELRGLIIKSFGVADVLREALAPLVAGIDAAFVYGSVAKQQDTAASDVDVMVISEHLGYGELFAALEPAAVTLARPVNPTVFTPRQWASRVKRDAAFVKRVKDQPHIWLIGEEKNLDEFSA